MLAIALAYAARGWPLFPVYEPRKPGVCSCSKGADCGRYTGKHPRTRSGLKDASADATQVTTWWTEYPHANIAIATGARSFLVLDVDGDEGAARLANYEAQHGKLPPTLESRTGSGGRHILFQNVPGIGNSQGNSGGFLGPGLDTRGDGGYIVAPPSVHASGNKYAWRDEDPATCESPVIAPCPQWIIALHAAHQHKLVVAAHAPRPNARFSGSRALEFKDAVEAYERANPRDYPRHVSPCPICPSPDGFKAHGKVPGKWSCHSSKHITGGTRKSMHWMGNGLDIDAFQRGRTPRDHLIAEGYWNPGDVVEKFHERARQRAVGDAAAKVTHTAPAGDSAPLATVTPIRPGITEHKPLTNSYAGLCEILRTPSLARPVLGGKALGFNELSLKICLDGEPVEDHHEAKAIEQIELHHCDKGGKGLTFGADRIHMAFDQIARENPFHPLRDYLDGLEWDSVPRLEHIPEDILEAQDTELNRAMLKRWLIACVARAYMPGCPVHTVLVLIGDQGSYKSTFFRVLASDEWFSDTAVNIHDKDSFGQMLGVWIYEWAELEPMNRARDEDAVKNFITSPSDNYRGAYKRNHAKLPRTTVIGATTNRKDFLRDMTGNRRFWPVVVGRISIEALMRTRDQLWAEAAHRYHAGEQWHLTEAESALLGVVHEDHHESDAWEPVVQHWLVGKPEVTVGEVLEGALDIPRGRWAKPDEKRVGRILRALGFAQKRRSRVDRTRVWVKPAGKPAQQRLPVDSQTIEVSP